MLWGSPCFACRGWATGGAREIGSWLQNTALDPPAKAVQFILELESPESTTLSTFWSSSTCDWLRQAFHHIATTGRTTERINHNKQNARSTLVICPLSTLPNWEAEICKHLDASLTKYAVYHGEERKKWTAPDLWANDIVLVTYDTVTLLYESRCEALFKATWFRIILDEAHNEAKQGHSSFGDATKTLLDGNTLAESAE
ncbi:hypothetical protein PGTUg99_025261 [Puccinia graminis f. sp. tritici]|uniref:SNF2 N-terminal domain-containing protein n=1 Tax=Puccinia graminis f. sp. tritici TaxID=56615 RepID=A0A5B0M824_PUCGR|nr:hypothetical protein PGTUg99_025261 [Puccinia graminis f. sp. tritici]